MSWVERSPSMLKVQSSVVGWDSKVFYKPMGPSSLYHHHICHVIIGPTHQAHLLSTSHSSRLSYFHLLYITHTYKYTHIRLDNKQIVICFDLDRFLEFSIWKVDVFCFFFECRNVNYIDLDWSSIHHLKDLFSAFQIICGIECFPWCTSFFFCRVQRLTYIWVW